MTIEKLEMESLVALKNKDTFRRNVISQMVAQIKRAANIWIWLVLTIIVISAVALIFLRKTTRKPRTAKKSTKAALNTRW